MKIGRTSASICVLILTFVSAFGLYQYSLHLPCMAKLKVIGLKCSISEINWGTLMPGENKTVSFQLNSTSTINSRLSMATESWAPTKVGSVTWNLEGYVIAPDESVTAQVTIHVFENVTGVNSFSFDIVITATEV